MKLQELQQKINQGDYSDFSGLGKGKEYIHPSQVATLLTGQPEATALNVFLAMPAAVQVELFPYLDIQLQKKILRQISKIKAAYILNQLSSDDRMMFYSSLKGIELSALLGLLDDKKKDEVQDMLGYPVESVARHINTDVTTVRQDMTITQAILHLRRHQKDSEAANVVYVVDQAGRLVDDVPVRRLVLNEPEKAIAQILDGFCPSLHIADKKEDAVTKFKEYDRSVLPVINSESILLGVITVDDVLDIAEERDTREIQRFGGVESLEFPYVRTSFFSLTRKRAKWLVLLFLGEMLTATAMGHFEAEISQAVVLALFIPLIISSGGNSGSQAATLIIRAIALQEIRLKDWWYVLRRELLSGLALGLALGTIGFLRITVWHQLHWYDYGPHWLLLAFTIFVSLTCIVMWGTLSGSMVPLLLKRFGLDPAASSAPFVATLVDVTGLVIYFTIAAVILKGTLL